MSSSSVSGLPGAIDGPVLFYDDACGFCARSVQFLLHREGRRRDLRFAPLAGSMAGALLAADRGLTRVDSMIWAEAGRVLVRSDAALAAARYLGGPWAVLATFGALIPRLVRDAAYRVLAAHRHRLGGPVCVIPSPNQRARFLEREF